MIEPMNQSVPHQTYNGKLWDRLKSTADAEGYVPVNTKGLALFLYGDPNRGQEVASMLGHWRQKGLMETFRAPDVDGRGSNRIDRVRFTEKGLSEGDKHVRRVVALPLSRPLKGSVTSTAGQPQKRKGRPPKVRVTEPVVTATDNVDDNEKEEQLTRTRRGNGSGIRRVNMTKDMKWFRELFTEERTKHPDWSDNKIISTISPTFHEKGRNGLFINLYGRETKPYSRDGLKHFADGRLLASYGSPRIQPSLLKDPLIESPEELVAKRAAERKANGAIPAAPTAQSVTSSVAVPESGTILKELAAMLAKLPSETAIRRVVNAEAVSLLAPINRKLETLSVTEENERLKRVLQKLETLEGDFRELVSALHDGGNSGMRTAINKRFSSWIHQRSNQ